MNYFTNTIHETICDIEKQYKVKVHFACESGSRAWGFASPNSDYDVRFIYSAKPKDYILGTSPSTIERMFLVQKLDLSGWDVRKLAFLAAKSNASVAEWVQSPVVYCDDGMHQRIKALVEHYWDWGTAFKHYLSLGQGSLEKARTEKKAKAWLYAIRCISCAVVCLTRKEIPDVEAMGVIADADWPSDTKEAFTDAVRAKQQVKEGDEFNFEHVNQRLGEPLDNAIRLIEKVEPPKRGEIDYSVAHQFILDTLKL